MQLSPPRRFLALFTLALGGFGIGTTEFATMGILPLAGVDLVPGFEADPAGGIAHAGWLITAYALGVVVGAPLVSIWAAKLSQRTLVLLLAAAFTIANLASGLMPSFELTTLARFIAGIPHGAYFGVAALLAARIMGPGRQGAGVALAMSGLTVANIIGVPLGTWLGQVAGWRWTYVAVAVIFLITLVLAALVLPRVPGDPTRSARSELRAFRKPQLWLMIAVGCIGFGGFFAVYSYAAEIVTRVAELPPSAIAWLLATIGVGMTVGNIIGGWAADRSMRRTIIITFPVLIGSLALFAMLGWQPVALFALAFLIGGAGSVLNPTIQARIMRIAGDAALLGAATNHAAFNVGNALGAALGGAVIAAGLGYLAPAWLGVGLASAGFLLALWSLAIDRGPDTAAHSVVATVLGPTTAGIEVIHHERD
ncbi:MFS transporter, DHA1 family, arabinose polymer transporter [Agrococcus baldri]|uniref:MFS transporter, DHA1 family, arabinose polymer transporter n=1 Tax=Agrococcus baldri TaxID=153730 RepID=A0AA94HJM9_9MICO|nr:MFS transporter [Agrococcus baldri]SFR97022.1 MFS transporter, DHA1 family, arabinose polymer transporter [Agrococcus baldri]